MAVRNERSEVRTKTTEGQYSPERLELARLVSSLLYGNRTMLVLKLPAFENKKYTAYDRFHGNGPYGEIPTKKEPIRTLGFTLPYNKYINLPLPQWGFSGPMKPNDETNNANDNVNEHFMVKNSNWWEANQMATNSSMAPRTNVYVFWCFLCIQFSFGN